MFRLGLGIHENIIKVAHDELVKAIPGLEGGLVGVIRVDKANKALVVAKPQVQGGKVLSSMEMVKEFRGQGKRSRVLDGLCIQRAVVDTQAKGSIRFPCEEDRSTVFRGARSDPSFFKKDITNKRKRRGEGVGGPVNDRVDICEERFPENAVIAREVCCNKGGRVVEYGVEGNRG
ncbi:hypothetical protein CEUSTIGMA_g2425.t1 [Chlamydomonas eustigma]|uniref:Uncharacterized protein n=1 Tax=Chlamydomonas eustigma TaxID=1157962 RepID=A0A250WW95_9CHLO|nr:hypothetical protein CEUSTIGMA_g2425.t1 [Chlamydomonas eustigma]|eukprot:GAX74979.1 hypothetical protein CEUSTIGMA_g2425.t1 [Chlamydomonas eustigma]